MKKYRVVYLDAFTTTPFAGNPCAVLPDASGLDDIQMQTIARETNLPETAFVFASGKADFRVRYFTPRQEIPFAGHPTIATSFLLAQEKMVVLNEPITQIKLEFNIGVLPVDIYINDGKPVQVVMTQQVPSFGQTFIADEVAPCFDLKLSDLRTDCPNQVVSTGVPFLIVPIRDLDTLGKIRMNRDLLSKLCDRACVSAAFLFVIGGFDPKTDTHSRFFDPRGTMEDPYTGSAAGAMGSFIIYYGLKKGPRLIAEQGHFVHRPGMGILEIHGMPEKIESVRLGGPAVRVMEGTFFIA